MLRAAYAVPTALVQSGAPCWLEFGDGVRIELPVPVEGTARMGDGRIAEVPTSTEVPTEQVQAYKELTEADDELAALRQRIAELQRARDDDQRVAAASAAQVQTRLETAAQQTQALEARAQDAETQRQAALARAEAAESEAASAGVRMAALEGRAVELEQKAQTQKARIETLARDLAEVAPAREALEREVTKLRESQSSLKHELDQSRDRLRMMTFERDELSRQAAAFDAVAVKARERAGQAETANEKTAGTLRELQTWRGELERRLAETTSELGAARAARETDERELQRLRATLGEHGRLGSIAPEGTNGGEHSETVAAQAEEIEHLAAELAALRARVSRET
ncbi:MAG: hypothetical protein ACR2GZ_02980 [Solirubrobacteraceae bacterium]